MPRRALLFALGVLLAGCVAPVADTTPTETPYPDERAPFPDGPKDRPPLPDAFTEATAREYAVAHEFRYSFNDRWEPDAEVGLSENSCDVQSAAAAGSGHEVTVRCVGYVNRPAENTATPSVHHDLAPWTVRYYLDGDSVLRTEPS
jgi:pectin methylesterase-like acyl-CoA thioesterase